MPAVPARDDVLGPVVIEGSGGQIDNLPSSIDDLRLACLVRKTHDGVGVGHIQTAADERHAERGVQSFEESRPCFRDAVAVRVAQQRDAVCARNASTGTLHGFLHDPALDAFAVLGLRWRVGLCDQDIAVGQDIEPARMIEAVRIGRDRESCSRRRRGTHWPTPGRGDVDGRQHGVIRRRQCRMGAHAILHRQGGSFSTAGDAQKNYGRQKRGGCNTHDETPVGITRVKPD